MAGLTQPIPDNTPAPPPTADTSMPPAPPSPPPAASDASTAPPAAPPTPGAQPSPQAAPAKGGPPLTQGPVDPELLKKFNANCMNVVTAGLGQIVKMVSQSTDKVEALAQAAVMTVVRVEDSLEESGATLNLNMTFEGGAETVTDIADAMEKAGVHTYTQQELDAAFLRAVDKYRMLRQQQGRLDPAMFQQIIQQMKQAQSSGTLDQQFPGLTQYAKQAQHAAKPAYSPQGAAPDGTAPAAAAPDSGAAPDDEGDDTGDTDDTDDTDDSDTDSADQSASDDSGVAPQAQGIGNNFPSHMLKGKGQAPAKGKTKKGAV